MTRTFIQTFEFSRNWDGFGLTDDDLRRLELQILENPKAAPVIPGTGGLRKIRFSFHDRGKRSGLRVCYVDFVLLETIYLITVYSKQEKDDLSKKECRQIGYMITQLEEALRGDDHE